MRLISSGLALITFFLLTTSALHVDDSGALMADEDSPAEDVLYAEAINRWVKLLIRYGNPYDEEASWSIGDNTDPDMNEVVRLLGEAAEQGCADAAYHLSAMYAKGKGVPRDESLSAVWTEKAADRGHAQAQFSLGVMYDDGVGYVENDQTAVNWYRKASDQGLAHAQTQLGAMYYNGWGVSENHSEAARWYKEAARQGNPEAQYNLAQMYRNREVVHDESVSSSYEMAVEWYRKAADQDDPEAQYALALMYSKGMGVLKDDSEGTWACEGDKSDEEMRQQFTNKEI